MNRSELKIWAKEKVKGKRLVILVAILIAGIITGLSIPLGKDKGSLPIGWIFYFVQVGLMYFMINIVTDKTYKLEDVFHFSKDFVKDLLVSFVSGIFIFLWSLLLIVPGIIKSYAYSMVPLLLTDDKYKDLDVLDILKKSEELMMGHKMDLFVLQLSFIGWHILAIFTLGILELWILPYQKAAETKFLYDIKVAGEK